MHWEKKNIWQIIKWWNKNATTNDDDDDGDTIRCTTTTIIQRKKIKEKNQNVRINSHVLGSSSSDG